MAKKAEKTEEAEEPIRKISIICSKGSLDMAYPGFVLANAARMVGIEVNMFFTFWGLDILHKKFSPKLKVATVGNPGMRLPNGSPFPTFMGAIPGMSAFATWMMKKEIDRIDAPPIPEFLEDIADAGAHIYACKMSMDMMKYTKDDLVDQVEEVLGAIEFYDLSAGAQIIFI